MKRFWFGFTLVLLILQFVSCKTVHNMAAKPVIDVATNHDLLTLQGALLYSMSNNGHWPIDRTHLLGINKTDSLEIELSRFDFLEWEPIGDSLLVSYKLNYAETDSIEYNFLAGKFYLHPNYYTLKSNHFEIEGETKDKTLRFESKSKN